MANQMNRHDTEEKILDLLEEIMNVYHGYNPDGKYLTMTFGVHEGKPYVNVSNAYWHGGDDEDHVITASRDFNKEEAE